MDGMRKMKTTTNWRRRKLLRRRGQSAKVPGNGYLLIKTQIPSQRGKQQLEPARLTRGGEKFNFIEESDNTSHDGNIVGEIVELDDTDYVLVVELTPLEGQGKVPDDEDDGDEEEKLDAVDEGEEVWVGQHGTFLDDGHHQEGVAGRVVPREHIVRYHHLNRFEHLLGSLLIK